MRTKQIIQADFNFTLESEHCPKCRCKRAFYKERMILGTTIMQCKTCRSKFEINRYRSLSSFITVPKDHKYLDHTLESNNRQRKGVVL